MATSTEQTVRYYALTTNGVQHGLFVWMTWVEDGTKRYSFESIDGDGNWWYNTNVMAYLFMGEPGATLIDRATAAAWYERHFGGPLPPLDFTAAV